MNAPPPGKLLDPSLVDHGDGRRLDRLGGVLVDRPCAAAAGRPANPAAWDMAAVRHRPASGSGGEWEVDSLLPEPWTVVLPIGPGAITLAVRPAPSGQIGLFLEQLPQWRWLAERVGAGRRVLSLFAHSGAATLAAAAAGAAVVSVDASRPATALARGNAALSGLADAPIAWLEDDARKVVARLARRGERFDAVVLDPPSWGHGARGEAFAIDRDLEPLLDGAAALLGHDGPGVLLATCHSPRWPADRLRRAVEGALARAGRPGVRVTGNVLELAAESGRRLALGVFARSGDAVRGG